MRTFLSVCLLSCVLARSGITETLHGTVRDSSGRAIPGAEVTAAARNGTVHAQSSSAGMFSFDNLLPPATLRVAARGFATASTTWTGQEYTISISLRPAAVTQQVVVTATRTGTLLENTSAVVTDFRAQDLSTTPALEIDDLLRQTPGFSLFRRSDSRTANPTSQGVSLRGLGASGASRALVLFDGVPLNDPFGGWVYWDRVPQEELGGVEVFRGGGSSLYGSGALAGVVNFRSRNAPGDITVDLSSGGQGTRSGELGFSQGWNQWTLNIAAQGLATDGYIPVAPALRGRADAPSNVRYGTSWLRAGREIPGGRVFVSGDLFNESRQNGTLLQTNNTRLGEGVAGLDTNTGGGALALRFYGSSQRYNQSFSSITADRNSETLVRTQAVPAQAIGGSAQWARSLSATNVLVMGADGRQVRGHTDEIVWAQSLPVNRILAGGRQFTGGAFVEDMLQPGSRLNVTAAARIDGWRNYSAFSGNIPLLPGAAASNSLLPDRRAAAFSPSLGGILRLTNMVSLRASAYGAFRSPTLNELYRTFRLGNVQTLANDELHAERLKGWEAGLNVGPGPVLARATFYWNTIRDAIGNRTLQITPALITRQRQNLGTLDARGVEFELEANLPRHMWTRLSYAYTNSIVGQSLENSLTGLRIPQVPSNSASASLGYVGRRWSATMTGRYTGLQYDDDLNQFPLPGYFVADGFFEYHVLHGIDLYVAGENLLDRSYAIARTPIPMLGSGTLARGGLKWHWPSARQ